MSDTNQNHTLSSDEDSISGDVQVTVEKKHKITFNEFVENHISEFENIKEELDGAPMKDFTKLFHKFMKNQETFMGRLIKMHEKDRAKKTRKHTENTGKSGFNKPSPVPQAFRSYLDLDDDVEMTRPQLVKALNLKFTEDGFKNEGQVCLSNKKVAKIFGVSKDHTFHAKDFHKFIKPYYPNAVSNTASANA